MKVVIPGGSGQVGHILARHFHSLGHAVTVLSRNPRPVPWRVGAWDGVTPGAWIRDLAESDLCINLAGRSVDCRYNAANRRAIYDSRIESTRLLNQVVASLNPAPWLWINASTATIYRHALDRAMSEADGELGDNEPDAPETWNFSIDVAKGWEEAFFSTPTPLTRKIAIRSALTLSPDRRGVFDRLLALVRCGAGGRQGPGTQFVSWIHEADFTRAIDLLIVREDLCGVVNLASPNPLPNRDFMRVLREAWGIRFGLSARRGSSKLAPFSCAPSRSLFSRAAASCRAACQMPVFGSFFQSGSPRLTSWLLDGAPRMASAQCRERRFVKLAV